MKGGSILNTGYKLDPLIWSVDLKWILMVLSKRNIH